MKKHTTYCLIHRITRKLLPYPDRFDSMTQGAIFSLEHDLHADVVPASGDLFGTIVPDPV